MKSTRFSEEQIIRALRLHQTKEKTVVQICRDMGVSEATFYKWQKKYGGMTVAELQRIKRTGKRKQSFKATRG